MAHSSCPFCSPGKSDILYRNAHWYARWDAFPATRGHLLVVPFRHVTGYFDTTAEEQHALPEMLIECRKILERQFSPDGYHIVINVGEAAEQKVMHCHVHMIPRYLGKPNDPPGGIRQFILGDHGAKCKGLQHHGLAAPSWNVARPLRMRRNLLFPAKTSLLFSCGVACVPGMDTRRFENSGDSSGQNR